MQRKGEPMADKTQEKLSFFAYMELAKQELHAIQRAHPELEKLSPREIEVFAYLLTDKTQEEIERNCLSAARPSISTVRTSIRSWRFPAEDRF